MLPFILYVVTGVVTGLHVYTLMFAGFGVPFKSPGTDLVVGIVVPVDCGLS